MKIMNLSLRGIAPATADIVAGQRGEYYAVLHGEQGRRRWQISLPLALREFPVPMPAPIGRVEFVGADAIEVQPIGTRYRTARQIIHTRCPECGDVGNLHRSAYLAENDVYSEVENCLVTEAMIRESWSAFDGLTRHECRACQARETQRKAPMPLTGQDLRLHDLGREDARGNSQFLLVKGRADGQTLVLWCLSPGYRGGASYKIEGQAVLVAEGYEAQGDAGRMGGAACPVVLVAGPCRLTWTRSGRLYDSAARWAAEYDGETWTVGPDDACAAEEAARTY